MDELTLPLMLGGVLPLNRDLVPVPNRERACAQCVYSAKEEKDRVCRFNPPRPFMFMVPVTQSPVPGLRPQQGFQLSTHSVFPNVRDDQWCSKHEPRI